MWGCVNIHRSRHGTTCYRNIASFFMFLHFAKSANLNRKINSALHSPTSNKLRKIEALFGILKTFLHTVNNVRSIDGAQNKENIRLLDTSIVHSGRAERGGVADGKY